MSHVNHVNVTPAVFEKLLLRGMILLKCHISAVGVTRARAHAQYYHRPWRRDAGIVRANAMRRVANTGGDAAAA